MRAAGASEVFMDGGLTVSYRYLFDAQLLGAHRTDEETPWGAYGLQAVCIGAL